MNREEIDNLLTDFDEMGFCPTTLVKNPEEYAIQWRKNMRDAIINHEQDTLKEFVEWLKDQNASYDEKLGLNMVCMDTSQLDDMLEYFIKEREND